ncbi:MAG TPA: PH domain-containing protein [Longimicrobiaceae bacterium]|nr:PH domain-containing protein [Longimicrobiaceae bacterium]
MSAARDGLLRLLRVPPEPRVPAGDAGPVRVFRAGARYYSYRLVLWGLQQLLTLAGLVGSVAGLTFLQRELGDGLFVYVLRAFEALAVAGFVAQVPLTFAMLRLDYELRWYIVTDRSLRIREGIASVKEKTMTFANVQNITVKQGPLQRLLGIADLEVRTAGGGGGEGGKHAGGESLHEAYFRGVDNADEIRDVIRERVRRYRDSGLGDPDDLPAPPVATEPELLAAAREMLAEARALRLAAAGRT